MESAARARCRLAGINWLHSAIRRSFWNQSTRKRPGTRKRSTIMQAEDRRAPKNPRRFRPRTWRTWPLNSQETNGQLLPRAKVQARTATRRRTVNSLPLVTNYWTKIAFCTWTTLQISARPTKRRHSKAPRDAVVSKVTTAKFCAVDAVTTSTRAPWGFHVNVNSSGAVQSSVKLACPIGKSKPASEEFIFVFPANSIWRGENLVTISIARWCWRYRIPCIFQLLWSTIFW